MAEEKQAIELDPHDVTRIWYLAVATYDEDDDLRDTFAQAVSTYLEMMDDLAEGGTIIEDGDTEFVSSVIKGPNGASLRFVPRTKAPAPPPPPGKGRGKR